MINARTLTLDLGGKWYRRYGAAPCPVCQPERRKGQNALSLADASVGRLLLHCKKSGCGFRDVAAAAGIAPGDYAPPGALTLAKREAERQAEATKRAAQAKRLWLESLPINGTLAETYLRGRGISCPLPDTLRFHPDCWHASAKRYPTIVARVDGADTFAVHRTYLQADGTGKADIAHNKMMLGGVAGGAVRLCEGAARLVVAEGIETALSLASGLLDAPATIWATLSASGMRAVRLPATPGKLMLAHDGDDAGRAAAYRLGERAHAMGWTVSTLDPGDGADWNDILTGKAVLK